MLSSIPGSLIVLIVFGIPLVLAVTLLTAFGSSLAAWVRECSMRVRRRFFCDVRQLDVDVEFHPNVFSAGFRDVSSCSAFKKGRPECDKDCLHTVDGDRARPV